MFYDEGSPRVEVTVPASDYEAALERHAHAIAMERGKTEAADAENQRLRDERDKLAARCAELERGLREIRFSAYNEPAIAIWMQKIAAHAMEPKQWPHPGCFSPADGAEQK